MTSTIRWIRETPPIVSRKANWQNPRRGKQRRPRHRQDVVERGTPTDISPKDNRLRLLFGSSSNVLAFRRINPLQDHFAEFKALPVERRLNFLEAMKAIMGDAFDIHWNRLIEAWSQRLAAP